jgi:hypothetical protein
LGVTLDWASSPSGVRSSTFARSSAAIATSGTRAMFAWVSAAPSESTNSEVSMPVSAEARFCLLM